MSGGGFELDKRLAIGNLGELETEETGVLRSGVAAD